MKLTKGFKWAIAAALSVATVAATVSIATAYTIDLNTNSWNAINIISNSGGHFELAENDAIKQARSFTLNVDISDFEASTGPLSARATLEYGSYDSNGSEVKLGKFVKNAAYSGDLTGTLSADNVASGKFWLRAADHAYATVTFHSISFFDASGNCILYGSADSGTSTCKWTFYQLNSPSISVIGNANPDGSYVNSAAVSAKAPIYQLVVTIDNGSDDEACKWNSKYSTVLVKGSETLKTDNITFTEGGNNEYEYSAYIMVNLTDTMNSDKTVKLYSLPVEKTVKLTDKYVVSAPDEPVVVDDSALKATTFEQRTEEGIVSFANAWSGSPVLSGGLELVSDTRPNCRIAKIVDRNEEGTGIQTYFVPVTYTDVNGFDPAVRAEQTVTLVGEADVSQLDVPNGYDNSVSVSDVKIASDYLTGVTLTPPAKTSYTYGETLDLTGGKLTLSYEKSADAEIPLTDSKVSVTGSLSSLGSKAITVTYNAAQGEAKEGADLTETFEVTVNPEKVADPVIAPATSNFTSKLNVTISCATSSAKIFYTTDGSEPTTNSTFYSGAFTVSETTTVKAIAVKENFTDSSVVSATFTKKSSSGGNYNSNTRKPNSNNNTSSSNNPIINGKSQTWGDVANEIGNLPKGGTMVIDLNGNKSVPGSVIQSIADSKAVVTFKVSDKISVIINGADITTVPSAVSFDFSASSTSLSDYHFDVIGGKAEEQLLIQDIGVPATLSLTLDKSCVSKFASIMKLNKTTGRMEFVGVGVVGADGKVLLPVNGKGDYVIIVDTETKMPGDNDNDMKTSSKDASLVLKSIVFGEKIGFFSGDFNGDDSIGAADASDILRSIIGL